MATAVGHPGAEDMQLSFASVFRYSASQRSEISIARLKTASISDSHGLFFSGSHTTPSPHRTLTSAITNNDNIYLLYEENPLLVLYGVSRDSLPDLSGPLVRLEPARLAWRSN